VRMIECCQSLRGIARMISLLARLKGSPPPLSRILSISPPCTEGSVLRNGGRFAQRSTGGKRGKEERASIVFAFAAAPLSPPPSRPPATLPRERSSLRRIGVVSLATCGRAGADVPRLGSRQRRSLSSDGIHKGQEPFLRNTPLIRRYQRRAPSRR